MTPILLTPQKVEGGNAAKTVDNDTEKLTPSEAEKKNDSRQFADFLTAPDVRAENRSAQDGAVSNPDDLLAQAGDSEELGNIEVTPGANSTTEEVVPIAAGEAKRRVVIPDIKGNTEKEQTYMKGAEQGTATSLDHVVTAKPAETERQVNEAMTRPILRSAPGQDQGMPLSGRANLAKADQANPAGTATTNTTTELPSDLAKLPTGPAETRKTQSLQPGVLSQNASSKEKHETNKTLELAPSDGKSQSRELEVRTKDNKSTPSATPLSNVSQSNEHARHVEKPGKERIERIAARALTESDTNYRAGDTTVTKPTVVKNAPPVGPLATPLQTQMQQIAVTNKELEKSLNAEREVETISFEPRATSNTSPTSPAAQVHQGVARHLAGQFHEVLRAMPDRPVDIALSPEELGRVRMSVSAAEGGVVLQVLAERPETLDLMRRHAEALAEELANLGFASIDLSFGDGRSASEHSNDHDRQGNDKTTGKAQDDVIETPPTVGQSAVRIALDGSLDIRL